VPDEQPMNMTMTPLRTLAIAAVSMGLAACGTSSTQVRETPQGPGLTWRIDESKQAILAVPSASLEGDTLLFPVEIRRVEREFAFDGYVREALHTKSPDAVAAVTGSILTLGTYCLFRTEECVGTSTGWSEAQEIRRNERPTGNSRPRVDPHTEAVTADVLLQAQDADGTVMGSVPAVVETTDGKLRLPLTNLLQQFPQRPRHLDVLVKLRDPAAEPWHLTLGREPLDPLPLYAEHWLPPAERQALVIARLKPQLLAGDLREALANFAQLEALPVTLPVSFHFMYGRSLLMAGERERGRAQLQRYLAVAGESGLYVTEARGFLGAP
jgi:hypothetical protein